MTGSASNAMDVSAKCGAFLRVGVWGREGSAVGAEYRLADCSFLGLPKIEKNL